MNAKSIGITGLLIALFLFMMFMTANPWYDLPGSKFLLPNNIENLLSRVSMYGLLGIGVAFVIITSGIDLSIGSIVCLSGCLLGLFLNVQYLPDGGMTVFQVSKSNQEVIVTGDASATYNRGDQIRFYGGREPALLTVKSVEVVQLAGDDGKAIGIGSVIKVEETLKRDDDSGQIARAFRIVESSSGSGEEAAHSITIVGKQTLAARDQLVLFHPDQGLDQQKILQSESVGENTRLTLARPFSKQFSNNWLAVPLQRNQRMSIPLALLAVLGIACLLGLLHGVLTTVVRLQPFVVTLCGLLCYRGISRWLVDDNPIGFGSEYKDTLVPLGSGKLTIMEWANETGGTDSFGIPYPFFVMLAVAIVSAIFLNRTVWGRYMLALGKNEEAARYSGINTRAVTMIAYVICTMTAAIGGMLFALDSGSISPSSFGNFYELYAIAAAVLGGCSLRGGEGSIFGVVVGTAVMMLLNNLIVLLGIADQLEYTIIGFVILIGVMSDEVIRQVAAKRRARKSQSAA